MEVMEVMAMVQEAHTPAPAQLKRQGLEFFLSFLRLPENSYLPHQKPFENRRKKQSVSVSAFWQSCIFNRRPLLEEAGARFLHGFPEAFHDA